MNVRALAGKAVDGVAAEQTVILRRNRGYAVDEAGEQSPLYEDVPAQARIQPLPDMPLPPQGGVRQTRVARRFYLNAPCEALNRPAGTGGDLLVWDSRIWLVDAVLEAWTPDGGWAVVRGVLQMGGAGEID